MKPAINNNHLLKEINKSKKQGRVTETLGGLFYKISECYAYSNKWHTYPYDLSDLISESVTKLCQVYHKFDENKYTNPFAYYTQIVHNSFLQASEKERKQNLIKDREAVFLGQQQHVSEYFQYNFKNKSINMDDVIESKLKSVNDILKKFNISHRDFKKHVDKYNLDKSHVKSIEINQ